MIFRSTINKKTIFLLIVFLIFICVIYIFISRFQFLSWDFRNNLWAPAHLLLRGQDPYIVKEHFPGTNALWLPMTIGLFLPLGMLDASVASNLWLLANIFMLGVIIWMSHDIDRKSPVILAFFLLVILLSPVVISHLYFGQVTIFFVLMAFLAVRWRHKSEGFLSGLLVAASLAKPQLAILFIPGLMVAIWNDKKWRGIFLFSTGIALGLLILSLPFWLAYPEWWRSYLEALQHNPIWAHPNLYSLLQIWFEQTGLVIWVLMALMIFVVNVLV